MTIHYHPLTLAELIDDLRALGDAEVEGLGLELDSYRGYYERSAVEPDPTSRRASDLADSYVEQLGKATEGYKGGDFFIDRDKLVYLAHHGFTGPNIIGLSKPRHGTVYEPIVCEERW